MQDSSSANDDVNCKKLNDIVNNVDNSGEGAAGLFLDLERVTQYNILDLARAIDAATPNERGLLRTVIHISPSLALFPLIQ
jgi:hypothetical protein